MMQGLYHEWPEEVADFVRHHCWLVNFSGKPHVWCAIDKAQEMNIKDIKVTYRSEGPNIKWSYLYKLHPAIPIIRIVIDFMEREFGTLVRGKKHTVPSKEKDIAKLRKSYSDSRIHENQPGRCFHSKKDKAANYTSLGALKLTTTGRLEKWREARNFERSQMEDWAETENESSGDSDLEEGGSSETESVAIEVEAVLDDAPSMLDNLD